MKKQKIIEKYRRSSGMAQDMTGHGFHSSSYHRHFEGYSEFETVDKNGNAYIKRVYTGVYYTPDLQRKERILLKICFAALWIMSAAIFIVCATFNIAANKTWYVALAQFGIVISMGFTLAAYISYCARPLKCTVGQWRSSTRTMKIASIAAALLYGLASALSVFKLMLEIDSLLLQLLCIFGYFISGIFMVVFNRIEANVTYIETPSGSSVPSDSAVID